MKESAVNELNKARNNFTSTHHIYFYASAFIAACSFLFAISTIFFSTGSSQIWVFMEDAILGLILLHFVQRAGNAVKAISDKK